MKLTKLNQLLEDGRVTKGNWEITPNHIVQYRCEGKDEEIKFKGSLIAAEPDALVISVTQRQSDQKTVTSLAKLSGAWKVNLKNQIVFEVQKESGKKDVLTFRAGWSVGNNHEIIYTYEQESQKRGAKTTQELVFKGYWDIWEKNRLTYYLGAGSDSAFRFRGTFQTKSILAKKGEIRYQVGVEVRGKRTIQAVCLFGAWKVSRELALNFEIQYQDRKRAITFGGDYNLGNSRQINVNLKSEEGEPLGVEIILTKEIFRGDGQLFIRLQRSLQESVIEAGGRVKW